MKKANCKQEQLGFSFVPQRNKKKKKKKRYIQFLKLVFLLDFLQKFNLIGAIKC